MDNITEATFQFTTVTVANDDGMYNSSNATDCSMFHNMSLVPYTTLMIQTYSPYFVGVFCALGFILGFIGNGTLLTIIIREKELHTPPNIYLFSIALGDFLFILVFTPFTNFIYFLPDWPFNEATCKFIMFLQTFSVGLSVFTLTILTCDRYIEVSKPVRTQIYEPSLQRNIVIASAAWVAAMAFATMDLLAAKLIHMHPDCSDLVYCGTNWGPEYEKFRTLLDFTVYCCIPAVLMLILYSIMGHILLKESHMYPTESDSPMLTGNHPNNGYQVDTKESNNRGKRNQAAARKKTVITSVSLAVLFLLCLLPRQIFLLWANFADQYFNTFWYLFKIFGFMTTFVNSCLNPIALCIVSHEWKAYFQKYLCCQMRRHSPRQNASHNAG